MPESSSTFFQASQTPRVKTAAEFGDAFAVHPPFLREETAFMRHGYSNVAESK